METTGHTALAKLLHALQRATTSEAAKERGEGEEVELGAITPAIAETAWPEFKNAVAAAMTELREEELEGVRNWREGRHTE